MKKIILLSFFAITLLVSCGQANKKLSEKVILKQVNTLIKDEALDQLYAEIKVGKYECNNELDRFRLRQLEAAGLITYDVDRYVWWEKEQKTERKAYDVTYGYYFSWTETKYKNVVVDTYNYCDHYIVNVTLTPQGEKIIMKDVPEAKEKVDKDLIQPKIDESKFPWYSVKYSEEWPEIPNPFIKEKTRKTAAEAQKNSESHSIQKKTPITRIDSLQYQAYNKLHLSPKTVILKTGNKKAIKARNIQQIDDSSLTAKAEVIIETQNVTDAGRILQTIENKQRQAITVNLIYYIDKGWVLQEDSN